MLRQPCVAGRFYDSDPDKLNAVVDGCLALGEGQREKPTILAMVPHAGYVFSGGVCGKTLAQANLAPTVLLLGPNHTGFGSKFALWPEGSWAIPGAEVKIDGELASALLDANPAIAADTMGHVREHSLEVVLPFLVRLNPGVTVACMAVSASMYEELEGVGKSVAAAIKALGRPVTIVVSSDMSHYISGDEAKRLDTLALEPAVNLDPKGMFNAVRNHEITMCGVRPMAVGLNAALDLGATHGELVAYANSGDASGDYDQVVGYAGMLVE